MNRRQFIRKSALGYSALGALPHLPAIVTSPKARPIVSHGIQSGDVSARGADLGARRSALAHVGGFICGRRAQDSDWAGSRDRGDGRITISARRPTRRGFQRGQTVHYQVKFQSLSDIKVFSAPESGSFSTPGDAAEDISFCWSGDTAGQGWGIDENRGGMRSYASMAALKPDFMVHSGDIIYADNPMSSEVTLDDGSIWKNELIEAKTRVAESTQDFRDNFKYNFLDKNVRDFHANVPVYTQWDDHEVTKQLVPWRDLRG